MSTKTTFKRIALVAVAALGLGVLSVAPSQATVANLAVTVTDGTAGLPGAASDSSTAATINITGLMEAGDSVTVQVIQKSYPTTVASSANAAGQAKLLNLDSATPRIAEYTVETMTASAGATPALAISGSRGTTFANDGVTYAVSQASVVRISRSGAAATANINHSFALQLDSITTATGTETRTAGTYTYTVIVKTWGGQTNNALPASVITKDVSIVIAAAADVSKTPSAAYSATYLGNASTTSATSDAANVSGVATAGTTAANLNVLVRNALNGATGVDTVTITVTGPGLIDAASDTKYLKVVAQAGDVNYPILADGTAGTTTISVKYELTGQSFTKSLVFYSKAAKTITAANFHPVLAVGTNDGAVAVTATDTNGNPWVGTAYIVASTAADALIAGSSTPVQCAAWNSTTGILCPVTVTTLGTAKLKVIDASTVAAATATSNEVSVTSSLQSAASVKIAFDKASYAPNEKAVITVTPLDAAGKTMQGKTWSALLASGGITSSVAFSGSSDTLTATSIATSSYSSSSLNAGSRTYVVYMPAASGDVTITATGGTDLPAAAQVKVTATATVVNASVDAATDAANEATDAANAATDAALAAADAADAATAAAQDASDAVAALSATVAKLVASLKAQITSLTNLVIKIQKKVKA